MRLNGASYEEIARTGGGILYSTEQTRSASKKELLQLAKNRLRKIQSYGIGTIEIKTGYSLRRMRDLLWRVQEVHLFDPISRQERVVITPVPDELRQILDSLGLENTY